MGHSEVSMKEGDAVELLKIGCAGWWYVKILSKYLPFMALAHVDQSQLKQFDCKMNIL